MTAVEPVVDCRDLVVSYGEAPVLRQVNLTVEAKETVALLGPSGSGKTTLLYAIAGFLQPSAGAVAMDGVDVAGAGHSTPPESRAVGMVFQNYALWPHLSAVDTVAYPLRRRGLDGAAAQRQAQSLLEAVGIGHLTDRAPSQLSGGEQQRVGLARAMARRARLFLFDEPTAHLDTSLRAALQRELQARQRDLGAAALYATHDAAEALAVADRVALLRAGRIEQIATPTDAYERPVNLWAARLTGPASRLQATVMDLSGGHAGVEFGDRTLQIAASWAAGTTPGEAELIVRPEWTSLGGPLVGTVSGLWYRGSHTDYELETPFGTVELRHEDRPNGRLGERVTWQLHRAWIPAIRGSSPDQGDPDGDW